LRRGKSNPVILLNISIPFESNVEELKWPVHVI